MGIYIYVCVCAGLFWECFPSIHHNVVREKKGASLCIYFPSIRSHIGYGDGYHHLGGGSLSWKVRFSIKSKARIVVRRTIYNDLDCTNVSTACWDQLLWWLGFTSSCGEKLRKRRRSTRNQRKDSNQMITGRLCCITIITME